MRKFLSYFIPSISLFIASTQSLQGFESFLGNCSFEVEGRIARYSPSSSKVRRIYADGWADYQLEISAPLACNWRIWSGICGSWKRGHSLGFDDRTKLRLIPLNLGVKYLYPIDECLSVYLGGAACYSFLRIHDHSSHVHEHIKKEGFGGLVQSGITYRFWDIAYASLFFDYYFQRFHFKNDHSHSCHYVERSNLNMNGYKVGAGIGIDF